MAIFRPVKLVNLELTLERKKERKQEKRLQTEVEKVMDDGRKRRAGVE